jgi:hypothetical protein
LILLEWGRAPYLNAADANGDTLQYFADILPAHGTLTFSGGSAADSVQFELVGFPTAAINSFLRHLSADQVPLTVLGHDPFNARCFWNWRYFPQMHDCPRTRRMLQTTADMRINLSWSETEVVRIA